MGRLLRALRAPLLVLVLLVTTLQPGYAQAPSIVRSIEPEATQQIDWKWMVTQGGLSGLTLVILWSYRRDMARILADQRDEKAELMKSLTAATVALTAHTDTSREQAAAFVALSKSVEMCKAVRQIVKELQ